MHTPHTREELTAYLVSRYGTDCVTPGKVKAEVVVHAPIQSNRERGPVLEGLARDLGGIWHSANRKYSSMGHVEIGDAFITVLAKKRGGATVNLKPKAWGLTGSLMDLDTYTDAVWRGIETMPMEEGLRYYLGALVGYYTDVTGPDQIEKMFSLYKHQVPEREVTTYFGEILGPIAITHLGLLPFSCPVQVYHPTSSREPLIDYTYNGLGVSAKALTSYNKTNTVKSADILRLLGPETPWRGTLEYRIMEALAQNTVREGPAAVARLLDWDPNQSFHAIEKRLERESKEGSLDFTRLFADAIDGHVVFVKFGLRANGMPRWETATADDIRNGSEGRVFLRTKNTELRASDRMGLQV